MSGGSDTNIPESPEEQAQAGVAKKTWADYNSRWGPVIQYYNKRTMENLGGKKALVKGQANADVQGQFGNATDKTISALRSRGVTAGSGKDVSARLGLENAKDQIGGLSQNNADSAVQRQYETGLANIIKAGRGERSSSDEALSTLAGLGGREAAAGAEAAQQEQAGLGTAVGTGLGLGASYLMPRYNQKPANGPPTGLSRYNDPNNPPTADDQPLGGIY